MNKNLAWIFAVASIGASTALGIAACSSPTTFSTIPGLDASKADTSLSNPDTSVPPSDGGMPDDSATGCKSPPKLFKPSDAGIYCPFSAAGDSGTAHCVVGSEICCLSPSSDAGASVCEKNANACPNNFNPWACSSPDECTGKGEVCCLTAGPLEADPNCSGFQKTKGFNSTRCASPAACVGQVDAGKFVDDQFVVCEQQSDCAKGTCTAIKTTGTAIGLCL